MQAAQTVLDYANGEIKSWIIDSSFDKDLCSVLENKQAISLLDKGSATNGPAAIQWLGKGFTR